MKTLIKKMKSSQSKMIKKKLLIVTTVPETLSSILSGQPKFLSQYYEVELVTSPGQEVKEIEKYEHVKVHTVKMNRGISPLRDLISIIKLASIFTQTKPTIIHSYTGKAGLIAMMAGLISGVPHRIHTFTGLLFPTQTGLKKIILMWVDKLICACATCIIPEGNGVKNDLLSYKITNKTLNLIWNGNIAGVNVNYFNRLSSKVQEEATLLRSKLNIPASTFIYIYVGRLNKDKGLKELVEAFSQINKSTRLLIVGAIDKTAPPDENTLNAIESSDSINMLGFMKDIRPALALANTLILPSYREGFPNVILQAGSMSLPVIATNINGSNEIIKHGYNGWLVKPRDSNSLLFAMKSALEINLNALNDMGISARALILEKFDRDQYLQHLLKFYNNIFAL